MDSSNSKEGCSNCKANCNDKCTCKCHIHIHINACLEMIGRVIQVINRAVTLVARCSDNEENEDPDCDGGLCGICSCVEAIFGR